MITSLNEFKGYLDGEAREASSLLSPLLYHNMWSLVFQSKYFTKTEKRALRELIYITGLNESAVNETILSKMRDGLKKMKEVGSTLGSMALDKLHEIMKSASAFAKFIAEQVRKMFEKMVNHFKGKYAPMKDTISKKFKESGLEASKLQEEKEALSQTVNFWTKEVPNKIITAITNNYADEVLKECLENNIDFINELRVFESEGGSGTLWNFVNKIAHKLESVPPFSWLSKVASIAEAGTKEVLKKFSELTKNLGGPGVYDFAVVSVIAGALIEYKVKSLGTEAIKGILSGEALLKFIPFVVPILHAIGWVALILTVIEVVNKIGGDGHGHAH
jgi:hypothetical protein